MSVRVTHRTDAGAPRRIRRIAGWRLVAAIGTALVAAVGSGCGTSSEFPPPQTTLIGLDGADWRIALPLLRQGKLPTLAALRRAGSSGVMLTNPDYRFSPVLWTTVATGKLPRKHGVTSFMAQVPEMPRPVPTPSTARKVRALWNFFTERERTVGFVGWWVTWPAEPVNGFIVSDHFSVTRFHLGPDYERTLEDEFLERQTYPESLAESLVGAKYSRRDVTRSDYARFARLPEDWRLPDRFTKFDRFSEFAIAHSVDRTHFAAGERLLREVRPELFGVFFQGIDILQHYFWEFMDPEGSPETSPSLEDRRVFGEAIEEYYRFADGLVARLIEAGGGDRAVMVVSDHGFRPDAMRYRVKNISGEHRRQAFYLHAGPGIRRDHHEQGFDAVDVTPTILAYHGLPVADDMDGDAVLDAFTDEWIEDHPLAVIPTWEVTPRETGTLPEHSMSQDLEERIRALGYIE
jgi:predicted AlkP superfamily phosphohydrolase/phosphomutase